MATKPKLYPAHEMLIKILKQHRIFVRAFASANIDISSWQILTLLAHMIGHIHIPQDKRHQLVNALFDAWDKAAVEHIMMIPMSIQAFRPFVLSLLNSTTGPKQLPVPAHVYLLNLIDVESPAHKSYRRALHKIGLSKYNYHTVIKFALILLSRMAIPGKDKDELLRTAAASIMSLKDRAKTVFPYNSEQRAEILIDLYYLLTQLLLNQAGIRQARQIVRGLNDLDSCPLNNYIDYQLVINKAIAR